MSQHRAGSTGTKCPWCGQHIDIDTPPEGIGYGPSSRIGEVVAMHADCAEEANADG